MDSGCWILEWGRLGYQIRAKVGAKHTGCAHVPNGCLVGTAALGQVAADEIRLEFCDPDSEGQLQWKVVEQ